MATATKVPPVVVFCDVNDTVFHGFTVASYIHYLNDVHDDPTLVSQLLELERLAPTFPNREALLRDCFRLFAGQSWSDLIRYGQLWYEHVGQYQLIPDIVDRLGQHTARGDTLAFVSGSWLPCLLPLARDLGAEYVFCCDVEDMGGRLTGDTLNLMDADMKAATLRAFATRHDVNLTECFAYGDDPTDIPMLELVGHPVAVHPSPELATTAHQNGWEVLQPAQPARLPSPR